MSLWIHVVFAVTWGQISFSVIYHHYLSPTSNDEHDASAKAHLGLGRILHGAHSEAAEQKYWRKFCKDLSFYSPHVGT